MLKPCSTPTPLPQVLHFAEALVVRFRRLWDRAAQPSRKGAKKVLADPKFSKLKLGQFTWQLDRSSLMLQEARIEVECRRQVEKTACDTLLRHTGSLHESKSDKPIQLAHQPRSW